MDGTSSAARELREAFIQAAREILDEPDTSLDLRKVADRVGKSRTAPYLAFGRTEEGGGLAALRLAVAESGFGELLAEIRGALAAAHDPEAGLRSVGAIYITFAQRHPRLFRLMFGPDVARAMTSLAGADAPREVREVVIARAELERLMRETIEACQRVGALGPGDPYPLVMGAWAVFHGAAMLLLDGQLQTAGVAAAPEDAAEFATRLVLENPAFVVAEAAEALAEAEVRKGVGTAVPRGTSLARSVRSELPDARPPRLRDHGAERGGGAKPFARFADHDIDSDRIGEAAPPPGDYAPREPGRAAWERVAERAAPEAAAHGPDLGTVRDILSRSPALRRARRSLGVLGGSRVLWIDDQPALSTAEQRALESLGVEVVRATDTVPALELLGARGPGPAGSGFDLVVSDIARPDSRTAGVDALPLLRQLAPNTPVIFYVGRSDPRSEPPPGAFGITSDPSELLHLVLDVLERRRG